MIYTVTFNPALDVSGVVDKIIPDEKCYVYDEIRSPGGNGINAGTIASRLGADVVLTGLLGGANGKVIKDLLKKEKIKNHFIPILNDTRMNITVSERKSHQQTRLSFLGPEIQSEEWTKLKSYLLNIKARNPIVSLGGSLPPGLAPSMIYSFIRELHRRGIFVMVDMPPESLKKVIQAKPEFIKPNLKEFQELTGTKGAKIISVLKTIKSLHRLVPCICVSSVEGGAILATKDEAWFGAPPMLDVKSTVGAGDSMVGAMATEFLKEEYSLENVLRKGLAAASATLTEPGLILGQRTSIQDFIPKIQLRRLY